MQDHLFREQFEENHGEEASLVCADVFPSEKSNFTCHAILEQLNEGDKREWVS